MCSGSCGVHHVSVKGENEAALLEIVTSAFYKGRTDFSIVSATSVVGSDRSALVTNRAR